MKQQLDYKNILTIGGAVMAFFIGSGFASGQEMLQFFAAQGFWGSVGAVCISFVVFFWFCSRMLEDGRTVLPHRNSSLYQYYCGKYLGTLFEYMVLALMFVVYVVMIAGAGATLSDYYGMNPAIGRGAMCILTLATVLLGLKNLVKIVGYLGPVIIVFSIMVGLVSIFGNLEGLAESGAVLQTIPVQKPTDKWWLSGLLYGSYSALAPIPFISGLGRGTNSRRETRCCGLFAAGLLNFAVLIMSTSLLANITTVYDKQIPSIFMADKISPAVAVAFSVVLIGGIYSAAVSLLWSMCSKLAKDEKSKRFKLLALVCVCVAFFGGRLPFATLISVIYPYSGYAGMVILSCMVYTTYFKKKTLASQEGL